MLVMEKLQFIKLLLMKNYKNGDEILIILL